MKPVHCYGLYRDLNEKDFKSIKTCLWFLNYKNLRKISHEVRCHLDLFKLSNKGNKNGGLVERYIIKLCYL